MIKLETVFRTHYRVLPLILICFFVLTVCGNGTTDVDLGFVNGIPVSKESGVTNTQALTSADNARAACAAMVAFQANVAPNKVSQIIITVSMDECVPDGSGKHIIRISYVHDADAIRGGFETWGGVELSM